jgi:hypothetical protein
MIRLLEQMTLIRPFRTCHSIHLSVEPLPNSNRQCDLITVAFNNMQTIEQQIYFVRKYMGEEKYNYIIADNSTDRTVRKAIESFCAENKISYIRLPKNYLTEIRRGSYSHGTALNWIYRHVVKKRQPCYFGFIDHDLFPIQPVSPIEKLARQPIYGAIEARNSYWYLWAGLCFFRFDFAKNKRIDFLPVKPKDIYLDTGGGNWYSIYSQIDKDSLEHVSWHHQLIEGTETDEDSWMHSMIGYGDDCWLHTMGGSNYNQISEQQLARKKEVVRKILENYL